MEGKEEISDTDSGVILHSGRFSLSYTLAIITHFMLYYYVVCVCEVKGDSSQKMSPYTHPHVIPNLNDFFFCILQWKDYLFISVRIYVIYML